MNLEDLEEALETILPGCQIETDDHGQIIINTGYKENDDEELVRLCEGDDEEYDEEAEESFDNSEVDDD